MSRKELPYIPALDGLRAIAAVMVMIFHESIGSSAQSLFSKLAFLGRSGVDLFFVLSGFLITRILFSIKGEEGAYAYFYARRVTRIFPLYFLGLFIHFFINPWIIGRPIAPFSEQIWSWTYLENIPATFHWIKTAGPEHYWSLAVEEHFYLFWPFLIFSTSKKRFTVTACFLIFLAAALRIPMLHWASSIAWFTLVRMDALALGGLLFIVVENGGPTRSASVKILRAGTFISLPVIIWMYVSLSGLAVPWVQIIKYFLIPLFYMCFMGILLIDPATRVLAGWLSVRPLRWLGKISYGIYVYSWLVGAWMPRMDGFRHEVRFIIYFAFTVMVSAISYYFYETPFLRLVRKSPEPACKGKGGIGATHAVFD